MFFLRRLRTSAALRRASSKDGGVLAAVRAELAHELSSPSAPSSYPPSFRSEDAPDFATVSDAPEAQDVLLRRRRRGTGSDSEEVVHVSALLAPLRFGADGEPLPRAALMKVLVTKPGGATSTTTPVLRFDCRTASVGVGEEEYGGGSDSAAAGYAVTAVRYHSSPAATAGVEEDEYQGPEFRQLDPRLQAALREYLVERGVSSTLATSILRHLLQKERAQYVNWLKVLEQRFSKDV